MNKEQQIKEIAAILKNSATESAKYFQTEVKKAFRDGAKNLKRSDCEKSIHDIAAEALYNAGYRKVPNTIKELIDLLYDAAKTREEIDTLRIENKQLIAENERLFKRLKQSLLSIDTVKEMNAMCNIDEHKKQAVKEFTEKLKQRLAKFIWRHNIPECMFNDVIADLLKEYE